jgi:LPS sulfotransferase NodH
MELPMSATNNLTYNDFATPGYASNVAAAVRQLVAALLAVKPQAAAAEPVVSQRSKEETSWWLNRLAKDCEMHSPSLSAELRFFASRG